MKRLIVCCDGTWQNLECECPTNVAKILQAIKPVASDGVEQIVFYHEGVGALGNTWLQKQSENIAGGAFGKGIDRNIQEAYRFLCMNYKPGDQIYIFGFSRGSYTARSLVGMIYNSGLLPRYHIREIDDAYELYRNHLKPNHPDIVQFREKNNSPQVPITLLGCWDTVGSLGLPDLASFLPFDRWNNEKYQFHDAKLSPIVQNALHATAIDEQRKTFFLTPMEKNQKPEAADQQVRQVWFPGDHSSVGGGETQKRGLSDAALKWMIETIAEMGLGLDFDPDLIPDGIKPDPTADFETKSSGFSPIGKLAEMVGVSIREVTDNFEELHESAKQRWHKLNNYRPKNLEKHSSKLSS